MNIGAQRALKHLVVLLLSFVHHVHLIYLGLCGKIIFIINIMMIINISFKTIRAHLYYYQEQWRKAEEVPLIFT